MLAIRDKGKASEGSGWMGVGGWGSRREKMALDFVGGGMFGKKEGKLQWNVHANSYHECSCNPTSMNGWLEDPNPLPVWDP